MSRRHSPVDIAVIGTVIAAPEQVEMFGESYARTPVAWRYRFLDGWPQIAARSLSERFRRMRDYYPCYCEVGFRAGAIDVARWRFERPA